jgi:hypothetical protein
MRGKQSPLPSAIWIVGRMGNVTMHFSTCRFGNFEISTSWKAHIPCMRIYGYMDPANQQNPPPHGLGSSRRNLLSSNKHTPGILDMYLVDFVTVCRFQAPSDHPVVYAPPLFGGRQRTHGPGFAQHVSCALHPCSWCVWASPTGTERRR